MKQHYPTRARAIARLLCSLFLLSISVSTLYSQNRTLPTDHFRSRVSGNWSTPATWESSSDSLNWEIATISPSSESSSIALRNNHKVTIDKVGLRGDQILIESGAILYLSLYPFLIDNGDGEDLVVSGTVELSKPITVMQNATIKMQDGSNYIFNAAIGNYTINICNWEPGSSILINIGSFTSQLNNLGQTFYNFNWNGRGHAADYLMNLPQNFSVTGDVTFISTNKKYLTLASNTANYTYIIGGDFIVHDSCYINLSNSTSVVTLNIYGNLNIGVGNNNGRLIIGSDLYPNDNINLYGNLNTCPSGSLKNGTLHFKNTNNNQQLSNQGTISGVNFIIENGVGVNTTTPLTSTYTLLIENGGSLITNSSIQGTMQRTLSNADWSVALDGWHLLASPVAAQTLTTGGFLDTEYDFYRWSEAQNLWKNQKLSENNITSFNPGEGYFVAYDNGGTKTFTGTFNVAPMTFTNLSKTETSPYSGYHLLGNPFPCAIDWGSAGWNRSSFSDVANVWNEAAMNYLPVTLTTNNIIPANQGFFVQALSGTNSITIPATARTHGNIAFNKKTEVADILHLKVVEEDNGTWDETIICIDSEATSDFDNMDGHEMQGSENAPQLYTVLAENEMLCVNALSANDIPTFIPLHFRPGAGSNYTIEVLENTIFRPIYLEDLQTGSVLLLEKTTSFSFSAGDSDTRERFRLHMDPVSLPENGPHSTLSVYSSGNTIYFKDSSGKVLKGEYAVTDLTGKVLHCGILYNRSLVTIQLHNRPTGVYLVAVTLDDSQEVYKIYLQN